MKLSFTKYCKRLLSKVYASDEQNLPIGPFYLSSAARHIISETRKRKYKIGRIIMLPAFVPKHCSEIRCIIDDKTSLSNRDINVSFIAYAIISALLNKSKANKIIYACSVYLT